MVDKQSHLFRHPSPSRIYASSQSAFHQRNQHEKFGVVRKESTKNTVHLNPFNFETWIVTKTTLRICRMSLNGNCCRIRYLSTGFMKKNWRTILNDHKFCWTWRCRLSRLPSSLWSGGSCSIRSLKLINKLQENKHKNNFRNKAFINTTRLKDPHPLSTGRCYGWTSKPLKGKSWKSKPKFAFFQIYWNDGF